MAKVFKKNLLTRMVWVLFALLPFHVLAIYVLRNALGFDTNDLVFIVIKMWKELFIVILFVLALGQKARTKSAFRLEPKAVDFYIGFFLLIGLLYVALAENVFLGLWSFRALFFIYIVYFTGRFILLRTEDFYDIARMLFVIGVLTSVFAIFQVEILGPEFQSMAYGIDEVGVHLTSYGFEQLRATATFVSAHEFGLFLVLNLFSLPFLLSRPKIPLRKKRLYLIGTSIILIGLAYSFSRSSIGILFIGYVALLMRSKKYFAPAASMFALVVVFLALFNAFENIDFVISGADPSTAAHTSVIADALAIGAKNPLGVGLGEVGVVIRRFDPNAPQFEGEWFNVLVQMGYLSAFVSLLIYLLIYQKAMRFFRLASASAVVKNLGAMAIVFTVSLLIRDLILPRDQMNYWYGWFFLGSFVTYAQNLRYVDLKSGLAQKKNKISL